MGSKGGGGGGGTVSNPQSSINYAAPPPQLADAYSQLITKGQQIAGQPLQQYQGNMVAGFNPTQQAAFDQVGQYANAAQPGIQQGMGLAAQSATPTLGQIPGATQSLMNPYLQSAVSATQANMDETNAQQQNQLRGQAIGAGAYGGDRAGVASAALSRQQNLANNQVLAGMQNQGYQQAQSAAMNSLAGDAARQANAGFELGQLGTSAQTAGLQGANAQLQTGGMQQQLAQQQLNVPYQQFVQQQAYPFQSTQWLASLLGGAGAGMGGTATTTYPGQSPYAMYGGLGLAGAGLAGNYLNGDNNNGGGAARGGRIGLAGGGGADDFSEALAMTPKVERIVSYVPDAQIKGGNSTPSAPGAGRGSEVAGMSSTDLAGAGKSLGDTAKALLKKDKEKEADDKAKAESDNPSSGRGEGADDSSFLQQGQNPLGSLEPGKSSWGSGGLSEWQPQDSFGADAAGLADAADLAGAAESGIGAAEGASAINAILAAGEFAQRGGRMRPRFTGGGIVGGETPSSGVADTDQLSAMFGGGGGGASHPIANSLPKPMGGTGQDIARETTPSAGGKGAGSTLSSILPLIGMAAMFMNKGGRVAHADGGRIRRSSGGDLMTALDPIGSLTGLNPLDEMFGGSGSEKKAASSSGSALPTSAGGAGAGASATAPAASDTSGSKGSDPIMTLLDPIGILGMLSGDKKKAGGGRVGRDSGGALGTLGTVIDPIGSITGLNPLDAMFGKSAGDTAKNGAGLPQAGTGIPNATQDTTSTKPADEKSHGGKGSDIFGILDPVGSALGISPDKILSNRGGRIARAAGGGAGVVSPYQSLPLSQLEYLSAVTPAGTPAAAQIDQARKAQQATAGVQMQQAPQQADPTQAGAAMPGAAASGMPGSYSAAGGAVTPQSYGTGFADGGTPTLEDALPPPDAPDPHVIDPVRARLAGRQMTKTIQDMNDRDSIYAPERTDPEVRRALTFSDPDNSQPRGRRDPFSDLRGRAIMKDIQSVNTQREAAIPPGIPEDVDNGAGSLATVNPRFAAQRARQAQRDVGDGGLAGILDRTGLSAIPGIINRGGSAASRFASPTADDRINAAGVAGAREFPPPEPIETNAPPSPQRVEQAVGKAVIEGGADPALVGRPQDPASAAPDVAPGTLAPPPVRPVLAATARPSAPAGAPLARSAAPAAGATAAALSNLPSAAVPALTKVGAAVVDAAAKKPPDDEKTEGLAGSRYRPSPFVAPTRTPRTNFWDAITNAGLGMMTSRNPNFVGALGEGGLRGVATLAAAKKDEDTAEEKAKKLHADTEKWHQDFAAKEQNAVRQTAHENRIEAQSVRKAAQDEANALRRDAAVAETQRLNMEHWQMQNAAQMAAIEQRGSGTGTMLPGKGPGPDGATTDGVWIGNGPGKAPTFHSGVVLTGKPGTPGAIQQSAERLMKDHEKEMKDHPEAGLKPLSYEDALKAAQRADKGDAQTLRREALVQSAARAEIAANPRLNFDDLLEKHRKRLMLTTTPTATAPAATVPTLGKLTPADALNQARTALAAGYDRGAVVERLKALGVDPAGL